MQWSFLNGQFEGDIIFCHLNKKTMQRYDKNKNVGAYIKGKLYNTNETSIACRLCSMGIETQEHIL